MKIFKSASCLAFLVLFTLAMSACIPPMNFVKGDVPAYNVLDYYTGSYEMYDPNLIDPFCDDLVPYPSGCHQGVSYYFDPPIFIDNFSGHDYFTIDQNVLLYENGILKTPTSLYVDQELWNSVSDVLFTNPIHNRLTLKFSDSYLGYLQEANPGLDIVVVVYNYYSYAEDGGGNPILGFAAPGTAPIRFKAWPEDSFSRPASNYPPYVLRHTPQSLTPRFPPHGRIKIDFSEGVNGAVYFDKPKPSDLRITDNNGIPIENQPLPMKIRATSVIGWEIDTEYNLLLPSEYERLFYDMVDATLNPKDLVYPDLYSLRGHALQDTSGAPLYTTGTGTIAADDKEPLGIFYEYYPLPDPPTGTEARMPFDLRFTTARVKITSPLYLGRYTDFPGTVTGVCTNDVSQVRITGLDDGTPLDVTVDCIAGAFTYSGITEPSTEDFFELRATVVGTTDDFDVIGVSKVSLSDQPVVSVTPYPFNNSGAGTVTVTVTGWPGASVCLYVDTDTYCHPYTITPDGTLTVSIPMGEFSAMTEGLHYITAVQYDSSGNPSATSSQANFFIDNQPPVLTFINPVPSGSDVSTYVFINLVVNDPSPSSIVDSDSLVITLDTIPVDTSNFLVTPFSIVGAIDNVLDGPYTIRASICDNARNCSAVASRDFNVGDPVSITSITPNPTSVASTITIYGTGFDTTAPENNLVVFGGGIWTYPTTVAFSTQMQVMVPEGAITEGVRVGVEPYLSDPYNLTIRPSLTSVFPQIVSRGQNITIEGTGFSGNVTENKVRFCTNVGCSTYNDLIPSDASPTQMHISIPTDPAQAGSGPLSVLVSGVVSINSIPVLIATPANNEVPEDYFGNDTVLAVGKTGIGTIVDPAYLEEKDMYVFEGIAGTRITINLSAIDQYGQVKPGGDNPDTLLELFDVRGYFIGFNDDINYPSNFNSSMSLVLPETGTYVLRVSAYNPGFYNLQIIAEPSTLSSLGQIVPAIHAPGQMIALQGSGFNSVLSNNTIAFSRCTQSSAPSCHCTISGATYTAPISGNTTSLNIIVPSIPDGAGCQDGDWAYVYVHNGSNWSNSIPFTWFINATNAANTALEKELGPTPINVITSNAFVPGSAVNQMGSSDRDLYVFTGNAGDIIYFDKVDFLSSGVTVNLLLRSPEGEIIYDGYPVPWVKLSQNGQYSIEVVAKSPNWQGTYQLRSFRVTGNVPARISMYSGGPNGNHQITTVGTPFASNLIVQVTDGAEAPVSYTAIEWSIDGSIVTRTITDINGLSSIMPSITPGNAGLYTIEARVVGVTSAPIYRPGYPVVFELLALETGAGSSVASVLPIFGDINTSDNHMKKVGGTLTDEFCALAVDSSFRPVSGQSVNWSVLGGGSISGQQTLTNANGLACVSNWTLGLCTNNTTCTAIPTTSSWFLDSKPYNTQTGINAIQATIAGSLVQFYSFGLPDNLNSIEVALDSINQHEFEGQQLKNPIFARLHDIYGNPISNKQVSFALDGVPDGEPGGIYPGDGTMPDLDRVLLFDIDYGRLFHGAYASTSDQNGEANIIWVLGQYYLAYPTNDPATQTMTISSGSISETVTSYLMDPIWEDNSNNDKITHFIRHLDSYENVAYGGLIDHDLPQTVRISAYICDSNSDHISYSMSPDVDIIPNMSNLSISRIGGGSLRTDATGILPVTVHLGSNLGDSVLWTNGVWTQPPYSGTPQDVFGGINVWQAHRATTFKISKGQANQYLQPGSSFNPVTFKLLNENGGPIPKVEIKMIQSIGGLSIYPDKETKNTDNNGEATFSFKNNSSAIGGALLRFSVADQTIRDQLTNIYDERGASGTVDSNHVPYICSTIIPEWCPGKEELRLRLVKAGRSATNPLKINISVSTFALGILDLIDNNILKMHSFPGSGTYKNDVLSNLLSYVQNTLGNIINIDVAYRDLTPDLIDLSDLDVRIEFLDYLAPALGVVDQTHSYGRTWLVGSHFNQHSFYNGSKIFMYPRTLENEFNAERKFYVTAQELGRSFGNTILHEIGHQLGLVDMNQLLGDKYWHNYPAYDQLNLSTPNIMENNSNFDLKKSLNYREFEKGYLGTTYIPK